MSFSSEVKRELEGILPADEAEADAENAGIEAVLSGEGAVSPEFLKKNGQRKAFLRGVFLTTGSVTDPEKVYHLEIVLPDKALSRQVASVMRSFSLNAKTVLRSGHYVVYLKESDQIASFLGLIGASVSLLNLESVRVFKDVRNNVNRKVNCETANMNKTAEAYVSQLRDIDYIEQHIGLKNLPEHLREIARVRMEYPEATLSELGGFLDPPVGKSGVNHRLRKLHEIAEEDRL